MNGRIIAAALAWLAAWGVAAEDVSGQARRDATGQPVTIEGRVVLDGKSVAGARVDLAGPATRSVVADSAGRFVFAGLAAGRYRVRAEHTGHLPTERDVTARSGVVALELVLRPAIDLGPLTVTGTMPPTYVSESPVKVEVVTSRALDRSISSSLVDAVRHINGLTPQVDCGVCYTNSIRINGMEGPYTAVLIDGMPIAGALGSVYGLNGIEPAIIEQVEIVRGPSSTLYGSEAMGGVVNVVTKDPRFAPRATVHVSRADHGQTELNASWSPSAGNVKALLSGSAYHMGRFLDGNGDGFSDVTMDSRIALFGKATWQSAAGARVGASAKLYYEDRFGGQRGWTESDRGGTRVYGEAIDTRRAEFMANVVPASVPGLRLEGSYAFHEQDSYYGATRYAATQHVGFGNALFTHDAGAHTLLLGATARFTSYDDNTPATDKVDHGVIPGVFVQDEFRAGDVVTVLAGARADLHDAHGVIVSPRASVKWQPFLQTTVRVNAGTGFRVVNVFTEDHAALTGARRVEFAESLDPERSRSIAVNVNQIIEIGPSPMMIDLDFFHTRFSNRIAADYDSDPNVIRYANLDGHAVTRGVSLALNQNVAFERLLYTVGVTIQDVYLVHEGVRRRELFAPDWRGVFGVTWNVPSPALRLDWSGYASGSMRLPSYPPGFERPTRSPAHSVHDLKLTWRGPRGVDVYGAMRNIFDYTQGSPLIDAGNPFGDTFDTSYVWGPIEGRRIAFGARVGVSR